MIKELDVISSPTEKPTGKKRRPDWLRVKLTSGEKFNEISNIINDYSLNTVCSEARCPNMGECWGNGTATFMILGE